LADKKKEIYDEDLLALMDNATSQIKETYHLEYLNSTSGNQTIPTATIKISQEGKILQEAACGDGPVDAVYNAIDRLTGNTAKLIDYSLKAITRGKDAQGEVIVHLKSKEKEVTGRGSSTDIIEASAKAYLNAINKLVIPSHERPRS
jgi:2-isopropylmalate synthase